MAAVFVIACPKCKKQFRASEELEGKKVRCKDCSFIFTVQLPKKAAAAPKKAPAPQPAKASPKPVANEFDDQSPYSVDTLDKTPRCPHCAAVRESQDDIVCIECGYNRETREHMKMIKTIENTGGDQFLWLLPGIVCVIIFFLLIGLDVFWCIFLEKMAGTSDVIAFLVSGPIKLWVVIASLFGMYVTGKFAIKRLIFNPVAPERQRG